MPKRRIKSNSKPGRNKVSANKVKDILKRLEATYALGQEALAESERSQINSDNGHVNPQKSRATRSPKNQRKRSRYGSEVIVGLAKRHGVHLNTVETARKIAKRYPQTQFRKLMRRRSTKGLPLATGHFALLSSVSDSRRRRNFENQALKHDLSVHRLAAAIREEQVRRGQPKATVGNKPRIPNTFPAVVQQIIDRCDKWSRWSRTFSAEIEIKEELRRALKDIPQQLASLDREIASIRDLASGLVASANLKRSQKKSKGRPGTHSTVAGVVRHQQPAKKR